ncbi:MAG: pyridoxal phosphate-dependent aminotransferase [Lachnospiraceae bacterium]|nr:pyridoxal phosphate-dependent aminotransferase [Lachnospiraceae bacterium]
MATFDEVIERRNTNSEKYDFAEEFDGDEQAIPMWVADMDFRAPEEVMEAVSRKANYGIWGYSEAKDDYYQNIISWFDKRHGWKPRQEWILKTPGVIFAISAAVRAFTEPGEAVMIQQPVYHPFAACITENGRKLIDNTLKNHNGRYEIDFAEMDRQLREEKVRLLIFCSPHNPVGRVWSREELLRVAELCLKYRVFLISDEIHCDFTYPGHTHIPFASLSEEIAGNCMVCTAPSKTFNLAGVQVSNIFVPDEERRRKLKRELYLTGYSELNVFALTACQAAYQYGDRWLDELLVYLRGNLSCLRQFLQDRLPLIRLTEPEGTYLVWLDFTDFCRERGMDEAALMQFLLKKAHVWLSPGSGFGENNGCYMRLNMACPRSVLEQALKQLEEAVY